MVCFSTLVSYAKIFLVRKNTVNLFWMICVDANYRRRLKNIWKRGEKVQQ
jgi:hypothetical protein